MSCETCLHWNKQSREREAGWADCDMGASTDGTPDVAGTLAVASDSEGYGAILLTHATFGCVQHEPKGDHDAP